MKYFVCFATALLLSVTAFAQRGGYKLGDKVADFSLPASTNQSVSLSDFNKAQVVVLVFTNTQCSYAKVYESRLVNLASAYAGKGVQFLFINPSVGTGDGGESLVDMAAKKYSFPYLADTGQKISAQFGATKTPEVYVLGSNDGSFSLKYKGAIDDNPQLESGVKNFYLRTVLEEVLANKTVTSLEKRPIGCLIKKY